MIAYLKILFLLYNRIFYFFLSYLLLELSMFGIDSLIYHLYDLDHKLILQ